MSMDIYAVTGSPVGHSFSPQLFNSAFLKSGLDCVYTRLAADSAEEALAIARTIGLSGMNVTAPFKQSMAGFMDALDPEAEETGSVNGVVLSGGRAFGFNTDGRGVVGAFRLNGIALREKRVAVIGAGGAGRAAVSGLMKEAAKVTVLNRTFSKAERLARKYGCRCEPLGGLSAVIGRSDIVLSVVSAPDPLINLEWLAPGQVFLDANYRDPRQTEIARERGCRVIDGLDWLVAQAVPAFEYFTGRRIEPAVLTEALAHRDSPAGRASPISLVGMMGAGKTTIGTLLASALGSDLFDTDEAIENKTGDRIPSIFKRRGEMFFRKMEHQVIREMGAEPSRRIYALGGGAVTAARNRSILKRRSFVIWLWADPGRLLERIPPEGRPLLEGGDRQTALAGLMADRLADYARASDLIVNANRSPQDVVRKIRDEVH